MTSSERASEAKGILSVAQSRAIKDPVKAIQDYYEAAAAFKHAFDESRAEGKTKPEYLNLAKAAFAKGERLEQLLTKPAIRPLTPKAAPTEGGAGPGSDMPLYTPQPIAVDINDPNTVFLDNVKGLTQQKRTIKIAIADLLAARQNGQTRDVGILLYGPPGTGKTMLAKAIAAECARASGSSDKVYFFNLETENIKNPYVGMTVKNLKNCFDEARKYGEKGASILFFDEIDSLTAATKSESRHESEVSKSLQTQLNGLKERGNIIPIAATNRPFYLPFELLREGRFGTSIFIPPPDLDARIAIFEQLINKDTADYFDYGKLDLKALAEKTEGYSGADIKGVLRQLVTQKTGNAVPDIDGKSIYEIKEELIKLRSAKQKINTSDFEIILSAYKSTLPIWYTQVKTALQIAGREVREYFADLVAVVETQNPGSVYSSPPPPSYLAGGPGEAAPEDLLLETALKKRGE